MTDRASGLPPDPERALAAAHGRWEASMLAELERLRSSLRERELGRVGELVGARPIPDGIALPYWGRTVTIAAPDLQPRWKDGPVLTAFDAAMMLHHLCTSDGSGPAGGWIGFRDLPGGEFYHQAYLGYTGKRLADAFGGDPDAFDAAAGRLGGVRLDGPAPHAWGFSPLPRLPLAACLWPGDEEMAGQAVVLFDAAAYRHMPIDGLALLGAGLTGRLLRSRPS